MHIVDCGGELKRDEGESWMVLPFIEMVKNSREESRDVDHSVWSIENWLNCKDWITAFTYKFMFGTATSTFHP